MRLELCSTLFIILLVLKICEVTVIPWLWVFMPLILMVACWAVLLLFFATLFICGIYKELKK